MVYCFSNRNFDIISLKIPGEIKKNSVDISQSQGKETKRISIGIPVKEAADIAYFDMYLNMKTMKSRSRTAHRYALTAVCRGKFPFIFSLAISLDLKIDIQMMKNKALDWLVVEYNQLTVTRC